MLLAVEAYFVVLWLWISSYFWMFVLCTQCTWKIHRKLMLLKCRPIDCSRIIGGLHVYCPRFSQLFFAWYISKAVHRSWRKHRTHNKSVHICHQCVISDGDQMDSAPWSDIHLHGSQEATPKAGWEPRTALLTVAKFLVYLITAWSLPIVCCKLWLKIV